MEAKDINEESTLVPSVEEEIREPREPTENLSLAAIFTPGAGEI